MSNKSSHQGPLTLADLIISEPDETTAQEDTNPRPLSVSLPPAVPSSESLPATKSKAYKIDGIQTDMFVQIFSDRIVLGVSQLQRKFGNYMMCEAIPDEVNPKHVEYKVTSLLGAREDTMLSVYAHRVTEQIEKLQPNPTALTIILAVSMNHKKPPPPAVFNTIVDLLVNLYSSADS